MRILKLGRGRLRLEALEERSLLSATPLLEPPPYDPAADVARVVPGDDAVKADEVFTAEEAAVCDIMPGELFYTCDLLPGEGDEAVVTDAGPVEWADPSSNDIGLEPADPDLIYCTFVVDEPPTDLETEVVDDLPVKTIDLGAGPEDGGAWTERSDEVKSREDLSYLPVVGDGVVDPDGWICYTVSPGDQDNEPGAPPAAIDTSVSSISVTRSPATPTSAPPGATAASDDNAIAIVLGDARDPMATPDAPRLAAPESHVVEPVGDTSATPPDDAGDAAPEAVSPAKVEARPDDLLALVDLPY